MAKTSKSRPAQVNRARQIFTRFGRGYEKAAAETRGTIIAAKPDGLGRPVSYTINQRGGPTLYKVPARGLFGEGVGAVVLLKGRRVGAPRWRIEDIAEYAPGVGSPDPNGFYSTPAIAQVTTEAEVSPTSGQTVINAYVTLYCVAEHYNGRIPTVYEIEVRDAEQANLPVVGRWSSPQLERVAGQLSALLSAGATAVAEVEAVGGITPPSLAFLSAKGIVSSEAELIFYQSVLQPSATTVDLLELARGYAGTTDVSHAIGKEVVLRGVTLAAVGLQPNHIYEVRARARASDNRTSNWTLWEEVVTAFDDTPPGWTGAPITPTVASIRNGLLVSWADADLNASDLNRYEVEIATASDFSGSTQMKRAGNRPEYEYTEAVPGEVYWFRVRAVDHSENESAWSNGARGAMSVPDEPQGTNPVTNPVFASNTNNWAFQTLGTGSKNHDTAVWFGASGSMRLDESRNGGFQITWDVESDAFTVVAGRPFYCRLMLRQSAYADPQDTIAVAVRNFATNVAYASVTFVGSQIAASTGVWSPVILEGYVPAGVTSLEILITGTVDIGTGSTSLWVDDVYFVQPATTRRTGFAEVMVGNSATELGARLAALDTTVDGKLAKTSNLSDLADAATARSNLGLGNAAVRNVGTTGGDVAAGNYAQEIIDAREGQASLDAKLDAMETVTDAKLAKASNLSDLNNTATARTNLGLGNSATKDVGTGINDVAAGNHTHTGQVVLLSAPVSIWGTSSRGTGTTTFTITASPFNLPTGISGVILRLYSKLTSGTPSDSNLFYARRQGNTDSPVEAAPQVLNIYMRAQGMVPVNTSNDQIDFVIAGATQTNGAQLIGYVT